MRSTHASVPAALFATGGLLIVTVPKVEMGVQPVLLPEIVLLLILPDPWMPMMPSSVDLFPEITQLVIVS